ncbi:MAG: MBOAT family protein [Planctomycetes bacterium]|nr:MBOAT family protein [Planctomycetota bacterium]
MLFSSTLFLFRFLPIVLAGCFLLRGTGARNTWLLLASLVFYGWGEPVLGALMLVSIASNWLFGLWAARARSRGASVAWPVASAVAVNLSLLVAFKYSDWLLGIASDVAVGCGWAPQPFAQVADTLGLSPELRAVLCTETGSIRLPIGISFFTFQALSYVLDVARGEARLQRNPLSLGLYVALFPQLVAGPIVRYQDVADQIDARSVDLTRLASGIRRFVIGLGKKVLIANVAAEIADRVFAVPTSQLTPSLAWLGIVAYTLQIYFDFSGYSDMAIGLGHMFGFHFLENFRYPYVARSITEFWRRWHISLSTWFRDYLYIPLGGNRRGKARTYFNLVTVFALCGLWHGASWSFLVWGLYHGLFLVLERAAVGERLERTPRALRHAYVLLAVMIGWVFFRAETLDGALGYLAAMFTPGHGDARLHTFGSFAARLQWTALIAGAIGAMPWVRAIAQRLLAQAREPDGALPTRWRVAADVALAGVLLVATCELAAGSYNPFIYFRF